MVGCGKPDFYSENDLVFSCNGMGDDIIFEGQMEGQEFCYTKTEGYSIQFFYRSVFNTKSNILNPTSNDSVEIHREWEISDTDYAVFKHGVSLVSPALDLDSAGIYFIEHLEEGDLEISNSKNPFSVEFSFNRIQGAYLGSSIYGEQCDDNYIRINSIRRENKGEGMIVIIEFEFLVKIYAISHKHDYFGELHGLFTSKLTY